MRVVASLRSAVRGPPEVVPGRWRNGTKAHLRRRRVHTSGALSFVRASTSDAAVWMPPLVDGPQRVAPGVDGDHDDEMLSNFGMSLRRIAAALTRFARCSSLILSRVTRGGGG